MLSKKQKKLFSRYLREKVRRGKNECNLASISDSWHWVRCPWNDEMTAQYTITKCLNYRDACKWAYEMEVESRLSLPDWDCSGKSFISHYHVGRTNIPHTYVIILYWSLDI